MTGARAYLGVTCSALGRRWVGPDATHDRLAEAIWQATSLPPAVCAVLARAEVAPEQAADYLAPSLRALLPDPRSLKDMERAAARILQAATTRERIAIFADYDVDGACSAALLLDWLGAMGVRATLYVPDRLTEGYGPNAPAMTKLAAGHDLIVCVDCGTMAHDALAAAKGTDVVVLDHHLGAETLPPALAVVNPNRQDEDGDLGHLCAAGVVFLLLVEANRQGRAQGLQGPDLMALLDLVALATVADVAPLLGVNRAFVRQGLKIMAGRNRPGLRTLSDIARLDSAPRAYHLGYVIGPRINAGGRIGAADMGARLLATRDTAEAEALAARLDLLNTERREIEAAVRASALAQAEARGTDSPLAWAADDGWHPGVIGIAAARLKEATNRPSVVIALDGEIGKGSGRSVPGIDLGAAIHRLVREGLLIGGGGHKMAAGLTVARDGLEAAMQRLGDLLAQQGAGAQGPRSLRLDGTLMPGAITPELIAQLDAAGPFGASAPAPRFALADMRIEDIRRMGDTHLRFRCNGGDGNRLDVICFGAFDSDLGPMIAAHQGRRLHLAGQIEINFWGGRQTPQLRLDDAAIPHDTA
ncbi:MAG: single-stranded-DNA-specific exonuclease RecJ [Roseibaca calidilacus]|uniref:Single-stranded-DNA-specific exonuclease RecJ n=1 Tax=Roseibaca calidilacus TaxID=1666912 RepID=A0A0P7W1S2_9RHOB|nr:single-stranded-DNA-specific exonuclease RecJ [Roseibaca calidilacus]KPP89783.1 MAG: single-stranded-DNA-specific exonuclease RecJ [Roseibaca calidilacus]CUX80755.1 exonuclease RecJ [Roseibaca calidilacus]